MVRLIENNFARKLFKHGKIEIKNAINGRNFREINFECKVFLTFTEAVNKSIIFDVSAELCSHERTKSYRVFVRHQNCTVCDEIDLKPYFN